MTLSKEQVALAALQNARAEGQRNDWWLETQAGWAARDAGRDVDDVAIEYQQQLDTLEYAHPAMPGVESLAEQFEFSDLEPGQELPE
jgi:hypothetical protein